MATTKRKPGLGGLGRGMDSIFLDNAAESGGPSMLRIAEIERSSTQPRKRFDEGALAALADSIRQNGLLQPVVVRPRENGYYELIAGERRWRAAKLAELKEIPAVILDADDKKVAELALIENIQREDLNPVELAKAYRRLMEEFSITQEGVATTVGRSRSAVANTLRLLELPEELLAYLEEGKLSEGHGKALLSLKDRAALPEIAAYAAEKELSVRATEQLVQKANKAAAKAAKAEEEDEAPAALPPIDYTALLEQKATERLGRVVKISRSGKNRRIELSFEDDDDLEAVLRLLCGSEIFEEM